MKSFAKFFGLGADKPVPEKIRTDEADAAQETAVITETAEQPSAQPIESAAAVVEEETREKNEIRKLDVLKILPNPYQPRKNFNKDALNDLAASIREFGVIQPLLVREKDGRFELIAGERRLRASKLAEIAEVPVIIKELEDREMAELAMIENLQREDLHYLEEAEGFHQLLLNFGFTQDELARRMGKSQSTVANKLRLLKLADVVKQRLYAEELTERHARALLKLGDEALQVRALDEVCEKGLNVRETELLIQEMLDEIESGQKKQPKQNVVRVIRDVRIFLNTIQHVVGEMKKSGLNVKVKQEQDEDSIIVKMVIPKHKKP